MNGTDGLAVGRHPSARDGACVMERASLEEGGPFTDAPASVSPALAAFLRMWNDGLDTPTRQSLAPFASRVLRTRASAAREHRRVLRIAGWLVSVHAPGWLRAAGMAADADRLARLGWPAEAAVALACATSAAARLETRVARAESSRRTDAAACADRLTGISGGAAAASTCRDAVLREHGGFAAAEPWFRAAWWAWCVGWWASCALAAEGRSTTGPETADRLFGSAFSLLEELALP